MKANAIPLLSFLQKAPQFTIPIWQRTYSWTERECRRLWDDILRAGSDDSVRAHFINSIVYVEESMYSVSGRYQLLVIDGQQRLTTAMLILEALARHVGDGEPVPDFSAEKIRNWHLIVPENSGERRFRLALTQTDKQTLFALLSQKPQPKDFSRRIAKNFAFFEEQMQTMKNIEPICKGLAKLMVVDIALDRNHDNPQLIFESMNSTGLDLTQADLIRNYVLMGLDINQQTQLYEDHWRQIELSFGQETYSSHFDRFMRDYLTLKTGEVPKIKFVYDAFKKHKGGSKRDASESTEDLVADVRKYAEYYCSIALRKEGDSDLAYAFGDMRELKVEVSYPFLMKMYEDYNSGVLHKHEFLSAIRLVESYVFRRAVCAIPTNSHTTTFAALSRANLGGNYLRGIRKEFLSMPEYRRFPTDEEFKRNFVMRDMYHFQRRNYFLRRLENHDRKELVSTGEYTVEHILPQTRNLSADWQAMIGGDWSAVQELYLHTVGNLTITGYNPEYGARPFNEKRDMEGGFKDSPLYLNRGLGALERWDAAAIEERGRELAERAVKVWPPLTTE